MKPSLHISSACIAALMLAPLLSAQNHTASLELEQSTNGLSSWQRVPITAGMLNNGSIDLRAATDSAFYRMKIVNASPFVTMITVQGGTLPSSSQLAGQAVSTFRICKYEVTWDEWQEVRDWAVANGYSDLAGVGEGSAGNHPVQQVSWYDVLKWSNAKSEKKSLVPVYQVGGAVYRTGQGEPTVNTSANGYRLLLEKEWEWAARGGVSSQGYSYSGSNDVDAVAWHNGNSSGAAVNLSSGRGTWPVGQKSANELGIHDMSGNVWEWCWDVGFTYSSYNYRRYRGGSWQQGIYLNGQPYAENAFTVASRGSFNYQFSRSNIYGFRLARNAP